MMDVKQNKVRSKASGKAWIARKKLKAAREKAKAMQEPGAWKNIPQFTGKITLRTPVIMSGELFPPGEYMAGCEAGKKK